MEKQKNPIKLQKDPIKIFYYINCVLMLALFVLQCRPLWEVAGKEVSIQGYVWFPVDNPELTECLSMMLGREFKVDEIILMPILTAVLAFVGVGLSFKLAKYKALSLIPIACGLIGIWGYMSQEAFRMGSVWGRDIQLVLCVVIATLGVMPFVMPRKKKKNDQA